MSQVKILMTDDGMTIPKQLIIHFTFAT